jgi:hypothetical protein
MSVGSRSHPNDENLKIKYRITLIAMGLLFVFDGLGCCSASALSPCAIQIEDEDCRYFLAV